jgi:hypothetical protein
VAEGEQRARGRNQGGALSPNLVLSDPEVRARRRIRIRWDGPLDASSSRHRGHRHTRARARRPPGHPTHPRRQSGRTNPNSHHRRPRRIHLRTTESTRQRLRPQGRPACRLPEAHVNGIRALLPGARQRRPDPLHPRGRNRGAALAGAVEKLARLGRAIAYDRRGCGRSQRPESGQRSTSPSTPTPPPCCSMPSRPRPRSSSPAATAARWRATSRSANSEAVECPESAVQDVGHDRFEARL